MATFPSANYLTASGPTGRDVGEVQAGLEAWLAATKQIPGAASAELAVTISGGSITPAGGGGIIVIDTEAAAASDDLANIIPTNYPDNACLLLRNANAARTVVLKHAATGSGQLFLDRNADTALDDTRKYILLQRRGSDWYEVFRSPARVVMPGVDKSATFTVTRLDSGKVFVIDNPGVTVNFEPVATLGNGWTCTFINVNATASTVTLDPNAFETIDRRTTLILLAEHAVTVVCDGTEMFTLGGYYRDKRLGVSFSASLLLDALDPDYVEVSALTGNVTSLTINNASSGSRLRIRFVQDATGGRTVALPSGAKVAGSLASAANQASVLDLTFSFSGSRWEGFWTQIPL